MNSVSASPAQLRCSWPGKNELNISYHDHEWGVPQHDEQCLFEMLTLEGAQAGLSWQTILNKREGYRRLFAGFDIQRVAAFDDERIESILKDPSIVRHRGKIQSTVNNARQILNLWERDTSLDFVIWDCVDGVSVLNRWNSLEEIPARTPESCILSKHLKQLGFRFVGETTCYALMQAAGLVNDHVVSCFRHRQCQQIQAK